MRVLAIALFSRVPTMAMITGLVAALLSLRAASFASWSEAIAAVAWGWKARPTSVSATPAAVRSKSGAPISSSRSERRYPPIRSADACDPDYAFSECVHAS